MIYTYSSTSNGHKIYTPKSTLVYKTAGGVSYYELKTPCIHRSAGSYSSIEAYPTFADGTKDVCVYTTGNIGTYNSKPLPIASAYYQAWDGSSGDILFPSSSYNNAVTITNSSYYNDGQAIDMEAMYNYSKLTPDIGITLGYSSRITTKWKCPRYNTYDSDVHQLAGTGFGTGSSRGLATTYYDIPNQIISKISIPAPIVEAVLVTSGNLRPYNSMITAFIASPGATTSDIQNNISTLRADWSSRFNNGNICTANRASFGWYDYSQIHTLITSESAKYVMPSWRCIDITPSDWSSTGVTFGNGRTYTKMWYVCCNYGHGGNPSESGYTDWKWKSTLDYSVSISSSGYKLCIPTPAFGFLCTSQSPTSSADCGILQCSYSVGIPTYTT